MSAVVPKLKPNASYVEQTSRFEVQLKGRDSLQLDLTVAVVAHKPLTLVGIETQPETVEIISAQLRGSGCPELLKLLREMRPKLKGPLHQVPLPQGSGHAALLMRELLLKARGEWKPPYRELELCHCRAISTEKVDQAIISGSHTVQTIARQTSAGTSCGTCRPQSEALIAYRLRN